MQDKEEQQEIRLSGISASPGICIGKAYLVDQEGVDVIEKYYIEKAFLMACALNPRKEPV